MNYVTIKCNDKQIKTSWYNIVNIPLFEDLTYEENMIIERNDLNMNILDKIIDYYRFNRFNLNVQDELNDLCNQLCLKNKTLDVGGEIIEISEQDINVCPLLSHMFDEKYDTSNLFLDMNPVKFKHILSYLKNEVKVLNTDCVLEYDYLVSSHNTQQSNINIKSNEYEDDCNTHYSMEKHFTSKPQITFIATVVRDFTKTKTINTFVENHKINDNEYKFIIPFDIKLINYYVLTFDITTLNKLIIENNLIIEEQTNFLNFIDKVDIAYGDMHICTISGDTMIYYNESLQHQYLVNNQIIVPFHYYLYAYNIHTHYNICENKLLNLTIKINDIKNYIIVKPYNKLLSECIDFNDCIDNVNCLVKHQHVSDIEMNRLERWSMHKLYIHDYHHYTSNIEQCDVTININNNCYMNKLILFISDNNVYLPNNLIKHVTLTGYIGENLQTLYDDSYHMISTYYKMNYNTNMSETYLIITFSPYCNKCDNNQISPGIDLTNYHNVNLNIVFDEKAINTRVNVLLKSFKTVYYKYNYIEFYRNEPEFGLSI